MKLVQRIRRKYYRVTYTILMPFRKIATWIGILYYRLKFRIVGLSSPRKAAEQAFELLCTPYSRRRKYKAPPAFKQAELLSFDIDNYNINGFRWNAGENSNGKKALICHGFDSLSYRFVGYVNLLREKGFEVFAFDAPAHGVSSGKTVNASEYRDMVLKADELYGPFDAIMAHSFGGIAVTLAVERLEDNENKRLVLIAPATETTTMVNTFFKYVPVSKSVRVEFDKLIEEVGGKPISWFSISRIMQHVTTPTLWVHDKDDTVTPYKDMEHLVEMGLPHVEFEITEGLGHSDIYRNERIAKRIVSFLSNEATESLENGTEPLVPEAEVELKIAPGEHDDNS